MTTEKNAIGFPTESGGFEEIASDAPKASPDGLTAQDVAYGNETVDDALTELNSKKLGNTWTLSKGWAGAGETALTLPEDWTEILVVIKAGISDGTGTNPVLMPKSVIDLLPAQIVSTGIMSTEIGNSTCARLVFKKINDSYIINTSRFYYAGVEKTDNSFYTRVYYR